MKEVRVLDENCSAEIATWSDKQSAEPGYCLEYRIVGTNPGGGTITAVTINDAILAPSVYASHDAPILTGGTGLPVIKCAAMATDIYGSCNINSRFIKAVDNNSTDGVGLIDNGSLTMVFRVKIP